MKHLTPLLKLTLINWLFLLVLQFLEIILRGDHDTSLWLALSTLASFKVLLHLPFGILAVCLVAKFCKQHSETKQFCITLFLILADCLFFEIWTLQRLHIEIAFPYFVTTLSILFLLLVLTTQPLIRKLLSVAPILIVTTLFTLNYTNVPKPSSKALSSKPNILFILVDTLRKDHMSLYGYHRSTTPYLDEFAKQAAVFTNTTSTSSWTKPSVSSLFTANELVGDSVHTRFDTLDFDGIRLGEFFTQSGYDTAFFTANPYSGNYFGATLGFRHILEPAPTAQHPFNAYVWPRLLNLYGNIAKFVMLNNAEIRLGWFLSELKIRSIPDLESFVKSRPESGLDVRNTQYAKQLRPILDLHQNLNSSLQSIPKWHQDILHPLARTLLQLSMKIAFICSQNAKGEIILDHWIGNHELPNHVMQWFNTREDPRQPFFAYVHFMGPHDPYYEQPNLLIPHYGADSELDVESPPFKHIYPSRGAPEPNPDELQSLIDNYDHAINVTDQNIQRLMKFLESKNALDNTIVVLTSDHGEALYDHRLYDHMYSLHRELVDIPLIIHWPKRISPQTIDLQASITDLYPTLLRLAEFDFPNRNFDGISLFDSNLLPNQTSLQQRTRYGSVLMGTKKQQPLWLHDAFSEKKKSDEPTGQAWYRMILKDNQKLIVEWESADFKTAPLTETLFLLKSTDVTEERIPVDVSASPEAQSLLQELLSKFKQPRTL